MELPIKRADPFEEGGSTGGLLMFAHYDCSLSTFLSYMWIFFTGRITWMLVVNISPLYFNVYNNYHTKHLVDINKISAIVKRLSI